MSNPFEKRATEYLQDDSAFLTVVAPEPLDSYFSELAKKEVLYDRLCMVMGTPGSGKTTIAKLLEYKTLRTLLNSPNLNDRSALVKALNGCGVIDQETINYLGCRLPIGSEYRQFHELPYEPDVSFGLLMSFLQSRSVISWINSLQNHGGIDLRNISVVSKEGSTAASEMSGGDTAADAYQKAADVERAIYSICAALVPPAKEDLPEQAILPYYPFQTIDAFKYRVGFIEKTIRPLAMFDDAHFLHLDQLLKMQAWLANREINISRWLFMRLDGQTSQSVLGSISEGTPDPWIKNSRETTEVWLQSGMGANRDEKRKNFRRMAKNMSSKYLRLIPIFADTGITDLHLILNTSPTPLPESKYAALLKQVNSFQKKNYIVDSIRAQFEIEIETYDFNRDVKLLEDEKLAMLLIVLSRYIKRVPQEELFGSGNIEDLKKPIRITAGILDGARIHLLNKYARPYYFGIDALCDASSENAEQFLQLAGKLVSASETQLLRKKSASLSSERQHKLLVEKAEEAIREWVFPWHKEIKILCDHIGFECNKKSMEMNAPLNGGANAIGIPDDEFIEISKSDDVLAVVLKYAIAYGAITIKRRHNTKNRFWTLIELSGPMLIRHSLTLRRGGFLERTVTDMSRAIKGE